MLKKLLLSIALIAIPFSNYAVIYYPNDMQPQAIQTNEKEIAWDIHNVLAQKEQGIFGKKFASITNYLSAVKQAPRAMLSAVYNLIHAKITGKQNSVSLAVRDMKNLPKSVDSSGEAYVVIFDKHNLPEIAKITERASSAYRPMPGMEQLVKTIRPEITQRFASNIGPRLLAILKAKFQNLYKSSLLEMIQNGKIVDYSKFGKEPNQSPANHLATVGKPEQGFFEDYNRTYNADNKTIIFIDDKIENIRAANKAGWVGIHFDLSNKQQNPLEALKADLATLGVLKQ